MKSTQTQQKERERERREKREEQKKNRRGAPPLWLPEEIAMVELRRDIEERKSPRDRAVIETLDRQLAEARRGRP